MRLDLSRVDWELASVFRIAYKTQTHVHAVVAKLSDGAHSGCGEGIGVSYKGETADSIMTQLEAVKADIANGLTREDLQKVMAPGGARNALDCAFWDLEAKRAGKPAYALAGLEHVEPLITAYTLSMEAPEAMAAAAKAASRQSLLKLKLGDEADLERVATVRAARPDAAIIVDANQSWSGKQLHELTPKFADLRVDLIEQPLPAGKDDALQGFESPVPICADESCQTREQLSGLVGKYQFINIKLDKTGGLTEALLLARAAEATGFRLMVGCMAGSSISMAPAFIIGQFCDFVDLDGPLLAKNDVEQGIFYDGSLMHAPDSRLWG